MAVLNSEEVIRKFIKSAQLNVKWLKNAIKSKEDFYLIKNIESYKYVISQLGLTDEDLEKKHLIFSQFSDLSEVLNQTSLSNEEKIYIVMYIIMQNLKSDFTNSRPLVVEQSTLLEYPYKTISKEKLEDMIKKNQLLDFINKPKRLLTKEERHMQDELLKAIIINNQDLTEFIENHKAIEDNYFNNDDPTLGSLRKTIIALKKLGVSENIFVELSSLLTTPYIYSSNPNAAALDKRINQRIVNRITNLENKFLTIIGGDAEFLLAYGSKKNNELVAITEEISNLSVLYSWLNNTESANFSHTIVGKMDNICRFFPGLRLSLKDQEAFIMDIIERNIHYGILEPDNLAYNAKPYDSGFEVTDLVNIAIANAFPYRASVLYRNARMSGRRKNEYKEIYGNITEEELKRIEKSHQIIQDHFLSKKDSLTNEDLIETCNALTALGVPSQIVIFIAEKYSTIIENKKIINKPTLKKEKVEKPMLSKKEYYNLTQQLNYYFSSSLEPIRYFNKEDIIKSVDILIKLNYSLDVIKGIVKKIIKNNNDYDVNPVSLYVDNRDRLIHYKKDEIVECVDSVLGNMMICSTMKYMQEKEFLNDILNDVFNDIDLDYDYELRRVIKK